VENTEHGSVDQYDPSTLAIKCSVARGGSNDFILSRMIFLHIPSLYTESNDATIRKRKFSAQNEQLIRTSIIIRHGHEFQLDGPPLGDDPFCKFYSAPMFGIPPATLRVGSSWHFDRKSFVDWCRWCKGTTTVTMLDARARLIALRVRLSGLGGRKIDDDDIVIRDGGIVQSEFDRAAFADVSAIPKDIGTPSSVASWTLLEFPGPKSHIGGEQR
jgi:hypothetical protein